METQEEHWGGKGGGSTMRKSVESVEISSSSEDLSAIKLVEYVPVCLIFLKNVPVTPLFDAALAPSLDISGL